MATDFYKLINVKDLIAHWTDSVIIGDINGKILDVNKAFEKITGFNKNNVIGKNAIQLLVSKRYRKTAMVFLSELLLRGHVMDKEIVTTTKGGSEITSQFSAAIYKGNNNNLIIVLVSRDITQRKKYEKKIVELNEILKLLNKILRHDILNDLSVASGNIDSYFEYGASKVDINRVLKDVSESMQRGINFIDKMKELESAILLGEKLEVVDIKKVLEEVKNEHPDMIIEVSGEGRIMGDSAFYSVIDNLVSNAKIHGGVKKVVVEIKTIDKIIQVRIADNGKGIPDEIKQKLFAEGAKFGETGNTGIGLYIVKKTIDRYGGSVSIEDNKPKGAIFTLRLKNG